MLPTKIELTKELAAKLRDLRLTHPVDEKILSAEALSLAIGNSNSWLSQVERQRLKKINREDIIKIFKVLYCEPNDAKAESFAESELELFYLPFDNGNPITQFFSFELNNFNLDVQEAFNNCDYDSKVKWLRKISFFRQCINASFDSINFCYEHFSLFDDIKYVDSIKKEDIICRFEEIKEELIPYKVRGIKRILDDEFQSLNILTKNLAKRRFSRDTFSEYILYINFLSDKIDTIELIRYINSFKKILFIYYTDAAITSIPDLDTDATPNDCNNTFLHLIDFVNKQK